MKQTLPMPTKNKAEAEESHCANVAYLSTLSSGDLPTSYHEAVNCPDSKHWKTATEEEIEMLTR